MQHEADGLNQGHGNHCMSHHQESSSLTLCSCGVQARFTQGPQGTAFFTNAHVPTLFSHLSGAL